VNVMPAENAIRLSPAACDGFQQALQCGSRSDNCQFSFDLFLEQKREALVYEAMRQPVESAVQLSGVEQLLPEQQPEQIVPKQIFCVINLPAVPPQNASYACLGIAPMALVNHHRAACAQKFGAGAGSAATKLAGIKI